MNFTTPNNKNNKPWPYVYRAHLDDVPQHVFNKHVLNTWLSMTVSDWKELGFEIETPCETCDLIPGRVDLVNPCTKCMLPLDGHYFANPRLVLNHYYDTIEVIKSSGIQRDQCLDIFPDFDTFIDSDSTLLFYGVTDEVVTTTTTTSVLGKRNTLEKIEEAFDPKRIKLITGDADPNCNTSDEEEKEQVLKPEKYFDSSEDDEYLFLEGDPLELKRTFGSDKLFKKFE